MPWRKVAVELGQPEQAPAHVQVDDTLAEARERDVAAVLRHRGPHARLEQLLDCRHDLSVFRIEAAFSGVIGASAIYDGRPRHEMLHDRPEDHGLEVLPLGAALRHRNEIRAEKDAGDAVDLEQTARERRALGLALAAEIRRPVGQNRLSGDELERRGIWSCFRLDEHAVSASLAASRTHVLATPRRLLSGPRSYHGDHFRIVL